MSRGASRREGLCFGYAPLGGAFEVIRVESFGLPDPTGTELRQPTFRMSFSELGTEGDFEALLLEFFGSGESGAAVGEVLYFARWPAGEL